MLESLVVRVERLSNIYTLEYTSVIDNKWNKYEF